MLDEILTEIVAHEINHPTHGRDCSCMDGLIQRLRRETDANKFTNIVSEQTVVGAQLRIDYVLRAIVERRR